VVIKCSIRGFAMMLCGVGCDARASSSAALYSFTVGEVKKDPFRGQARVSFWVLSQNSNAINAIYKIKSIYKHYMSIIR